MKIVTYNIQFGLGKDGCFNLQRIADTVDGADIITLQEVERNWQHSGYVDQPEELGRLLSRYYWVYGPYFDVDASSRNPDRTVNNQRRQFGTMTLSKTPVLSSRLFPLPKSIINEQRNMVVGMLEAVVDQGRGKALRIYNAHLSAKSEADRIAQIHTIRRHIFDAPNQGGAWTGVGLPPLWEEDEVSPPMPNEFVLLGDFNLSPKDPEYHHLTNVDENECDLVDCWMLGENQKADGITFPVNAEANTDIGHRLDFAFVNDAMEKRVRSACIDEAALGSDHQPYWIEFDNAAFE